VGNEGTWWIVENTGNEVFKDLQDMVNIVSSSYHTLMFGAGMETWLFYV
jgi:hypothetical protein